MAHATATDTRGLDAGRDPKRLAVARYTVWGSFLGLAWGLSLRAWMTVLAVDFGDWPEFTHRGTFGGVIGPALVMGAALGWAEAVRRTGGRPGWRWAASAPLLTAAPAAIITPGFVETLLEDGRGSGALGVAALGLTGGYAISGRGPAWTRACAAVVPAVVTTAMAWFVLFDGVDTLEARSLFVALMFLVLMAVLVLAASIPHRRVMTADPTDARTSPVTGTGTARQPAPTPAGSGTPTRFRVGWGVLLALAGSQTVHSLVLALIDTADWVAAHAGWTAMAAITLAVLVVPYRARETWAWFTLWAFVVAHAVVGLTELDEPAIGYWYLGVAVVMGVAQWLTWPDVAAVRRRLSPRGRGRAPVRP